MFPLSNLITLLCVCQSESVGGANLNAVVQILVEVTLALGDGSNFTVGAQALGQFHSNTNFTGVLGGGAFAVNGNESRASLDVPASIGTQSTFETYVGLGGSGGVLGASETSVGLNVYIRTSDSCASEQRGSSNGSQSRFNHCSKGMSRGINPRMIKIST